MGYVTSTRVLSDWNSCRVVLPLAVAGAAVRGDRFLGSCRTAVSYWNDNSGSDTAKRVAVDSHTTFIAQEAARVYKTRPRERYV